MKTLTGEKLLAFCATVLLLTGCNSNETPGQIGHIVLDPPAPKLDVQDSIVTSSVSQVGIDITLTQQKIRDLVEQSIPHRIDSNGPIQKELTHWVIDDYYKYWFERGAINLTFNQKSITFEMPIKGQLEGGGNIYVNMPWPVPDIRKHIQETADISGKIIGQVDLAIGADFNIICVPHFELVLDRSELAIFTGTKFDLKKQTYDFFNAQVPLLVQKAANKAIEEFNLRKKIETAWTKLNCVNSISETPPTYVVVTPKELRIKPISFNSDPMQVVLSIIANTVVKIQNAPPQPSLNGPLPSLVFDPNLTSTMNLQVPVQASLETITAQLNKAVAGKKILIPEVKTEVVVKSATLLTAGSMVICALDVDATNNALNKTASGTIYLTGHLALTATNKLSLTDLDFDIKTHDWLVSSAHWLLHKTIVDQIRNGTEFDATVLLDNARKDLNTELLKLAEDKALSFNLSVDKVTVDDIKVARGQAYVMFNITGTSHAAIN